MALSSGRCISRGLRDGMMLDPYNSIIVIILSLMTRKLLNFRTLYATTNVDAVMDAYPRVLKKKLLSYQDSIEIARMLQYANRLDSFGSKEALVTYMERFVQDYQSRRLPPHARASLHIIGYLKESGQHDTGIKFWTWLLGQDDNYINIDTYGAAIELLANYGRSLDYCEEVYMHALKRFPSHYNEYHMSHGALLPDRRQITTLKGVSIILLQGIVYARLLHGDWRNAYLGLDTALRLYPTQLPTQYVNMLLYERPIHEAFQLYCLTCQSSNRPSEKCHAVLLNYLAIAQADNRSDEYNLQLAKAMVAAFHHYIGAGGKVNQLHLNLALQCSLGVIRYMPNDMGVSPASDGEKRIVFAVAELLSQVFDMFTRLGISPDIRTFNHMISIAGRLKFPWLATTAMERLVNAGLRPDLQTFRTLIIAAGESQDTAAIESVWSSLKEYHFENESELEALDWRALAKALKSAGATSLLDKKIEVHKIRSNEYLMKNIAFELRKKTLVESSVVPGQITPARCIQYITEVYDEFDVLNGLIKSQLTGNLKATPPTRKSILPWPEFADENWQRKLYDDTTSDATRRSGIDQTDLASTDIVPNHNIVRTRTGFTFEEIRYQNWKGINNLMIQAELFETQMTQIVDEAMQQGNPSKISRNLKDVSNKSEKRSLALTHFDIHAQNLKDIGGMQMTEPEWRAKILELRRVEPWSSG